MEDIESGRMVFCGACPLICETDDDLTILGTTLISQACMYCWFTFREKYSFGIFAGDSLQITDYSGDFRESRLNEAKEIVLIAAGTGVLLMIIIIIKASLSNSLCQLIINRSISECCRPSVHSSVRPCSQSVRPSVRPSVSPSLRPSVSHSASQSVCPSVCQSVSPSVPPSLRPSVSLLVSQSVSQSVSPCIRLSVRSSVSQSFRPSVGLSVCRSVGLSVCQSVSLSVSQSVVSCSIIFVNCFFYQAYLAYACAVFSTDQFA